LQKFTEYEARCLAKAFAKNVSLETISFTQVKLNAHLTTILIRPLLGHPRLNTLKFSGSMIFEETEGTGQAASDEHITQPLPPLTQPKEEEELKSSDEEVVRKQHCSCLKIWWNRISSNRCCQAFQKYAQLLGDKDTPASSNLEILKLLCRMLTEGDLKILDLSNNELGSKDVLLAIGTAISESKCNVLRLDNNALGDHKRIADCMTRIAKGRVRLHSLSLSRNNLGDSHIGFLNTMLQKKTTLHRLLLSHNKFSDKAALSLSSKFCERRIPIDKNANSELVLDLRFNEISEKVVHDIEKKFQQARNPSSLRIRLFGQQALSDNCLSSISS